MEKILEILNVKTVTTMMVTAEISNVVLNQVTLEQVETRLHQTHDTNEVMGSLQVSKRVMTVILTTMMVEIAPET